MSNSAILFFFIAILVVAVLLFIVIAVTKKGTVQLDVEKYRSRWLHIEQALKRDEVSSYHLCVLNADKLVDQALRDHGIRGETMGERLKAAHDSWSNANALWSAHKLRNRIAHETDAKVGYDDARRALAGFKQALRDIGAI